RDPPSGDRAPAPDTARRPARARSDAMSDERRDDEILGRALGRAIETLHVNETPYERSRMASPAERRARFGLPQVAATIAGVALAVALGALFNRVRETLEAPAVGHPTAAPGT